MAMLHSIVVGELMPGEFLSELQLAERFQTSRTPVREACIHLFTEGLLSSAPHKGYVVTEISMDEVRELYQLRQILEPEAAAMAALRHLDQEFSTKGEALLDELNRLSHQEFSYEIILRMSELEYGFHHAVAVASGSKRLARFISELMNQFRRYTYAHLRTRPPLQHVPEEHQAILAAIRAHNVSVARQLMYEHVASASDRWARLMSSSFTRRG